jgi:hypothetical protein
MVHKLDVFDIVGDRIPRSPLIILAMEYMAECPRDAGKPNVKSIKLPVRILGYILKSPQKWTFSSLDLFYIIQ